VQSVTVMFSQESDLGATTAPGHRGVGRDDAGTDSIPRDAGQCAASLSP
jgi:hypothetical protein